MSAAKPGAIQSMTGYGHAEAAAAGWHCAVELRSVNSRHLELRLRLPNGLGHMEDALKKRLRERCERGKVEGTGTLTAEGEGRNEWVVNRPALARYALLVQEAARGGVPAQVTLGDLLNAREPILRSALEGNTEAVEPLVERTFALATDALVKMREREGAALAADLASRFALLRNHLAAIVPLTQDLPRQQARRLREHLAKLVGLASETPEASGQLPARFSSSQEERLLLEIALMAERSDVSEEISRFGTHLDHLEQLLTQGGPLGRKFEFLLQELQREANTLSVKSSQTQVSAHVVEIKTELERLREQIQNVE
ncbi:MAG: YicC/YloC family endoribonuclease [SAR324 cluster bacterium]